MDDHKGAALSLNADLKSLFGLDSVTYKYELSKEELFHEAIAHDQDEAYADDLDVERIDDDGLSIDELVAAERWVEAAVVPFGGVFAGT